MINIDNEFAHTLNNNHSHKETHIIHHISGWFSFARLSFYLSAQGTLLSGIIHTK